MAILWIFRACFTSLGSKHVGSLLFLLLETKEVLSPCEWGLAAVGCFAFCMQQTPHLHLLYTPSCKVAHPFPHFTKEIRASFGNASQNLLLFMQSSKIWILCKWFCFDFFFFFWSLCLRDSVISAQWAPHVSRSPLDYDWLSLFPWSLQPACSLQAGVWGKSYALKHWLLLWNDGWRCRECHFSCLVGLQVLGCRLQIFTSDHEALL